jgi:hypothetical protein
VLEGGRHRHDPAEHQPNSLNADFHSVPSVHLPDTNRAAVKAYAATAGATAKINQSTIVFTAPRRSRRRSRRAAR